MQCFARAVTQPTSIYIFTMTIQQAKLTIQHFFNKTIVQTILIVLVFISTVSIIVEFLYPHFFEQYHLVFHSIEYSILGIFTVEYVLRLWSAPKRLSFMKQPFNLIDLLAILPSYIEIILSATPVASALRTIRLLRLLRFSRLLRAFKLFRYQKFFSDILQYHDTILQSITPILIVLVLLKAGIIFLEYHNLWIHDTNLAELFAIIGFALGIILSQKIGTTYSKFTQVEEVAVRIYSTLMTLQTLTPSSVYNSWVRHFLTALTKPESASRTTLQEHTVGIYKIIQAIEPKPGELTMVYKNLVEDSQFCLSKAKRLTPLAYDTLLHQATILYLLLIALFIPGITGIISVLIATYILYGMYRVTQDLDSIIGGNYKLINIDLSELRALAQETN